MSSQNNKIKAIAWDLDGTIVYFNIDFIQARKYTINILKENGINPSDLDIKRSILDNINVGKEKFKEMHFPTKEVKKIFSKIEEAIIQVESQAVENAKKVEGIKKVLKFCNRYGMLQAIYTLNTNLNAKKTLENVNLLKYFDLIIGRDNVSNPKPHSDHLSNICKKFNINNEEILVIGDNPRDIEGANKIGAPSIGILTDRHTKKDLKGAKYIVEQKNIAQDLMGAIKTFL